jgi:hypothetical protein
MGLEFQENYDRLSGKTNILGHDVLMFKQSTASGIVGATSMATVAGNTRVTLPRGGVMQYVTSDVGRQLLGGQLNLQVKKNGSIVASGSHTTSNGALREWVFGHNQNFAKHTVASGDYIEVDYSVDTALVYGEHAGQLVKVGILYLE